MQKVTKALTDCRTSRMLPDEGNAAPDVLNLFFARFDTNRGEAVPVTEPANQETTPVLQQHQVRAALKEINIPKVAGPDQITGRVQISSLRYWPTCSASPYNMELKNIYHHPCAQKKTAVKCLNDYQPVALTLIAMQCFGKLVLSHIRNTISPDLDKYQFAYWGQPLHWGHFTLHSHLEGPNSYMKMCRLQNWMHSSLTNWSEHPGPWFPFYVRGS